MRYSHSKLVVTPRRGGAWLADGWSLHPDGSYTLYEQEIMSTEELATLIDILTENSDNVEVQCPFEYAGDA